MITPKDLHPLLRLWRLFPVDARRALFARITAAIAPKADAHPPPAKGGILVGGEIGRMSGLGESARVMAQALANIGVPTWSIDVGLPIPGEGGPLFRKNMTMPAGVPAHAPLVLHVNGPMLPMTLLQAPTGLLRGRRVVGYWAWELPTVPDNWRVGLGMVHEIWANSSFAADAFRNWLPPDSPIKVRAVPIPLAEAPPVPSSLGRADFGLPADAVVVLVSFSMASSFERKNPLAAIAAFRQAFAARPDRLLLLKIGSADLFPAEMAEIHAAIGGAANIRIETRRFPTADLHALTACADIVLSLHRSEGFGLVPAEAMLLGRAVVATGWSGNMDFMDETSAALVPYRLIPARDPRGVFEAPDAVWADADIGAAAALLRHLADDAPYRDGLAARGQAMARQKLGAEALRAAVAGLGLPV